MTLEQRRNRRARCYMEFCCHEATVGVVDYGTGRSGPFDPNHPVYEYRGRWGWCRQHESNYRPEPADGANH